MQIIVIGFFWLLLGFHLYSFAQENPHNNSVFEEYVEKNKGILPENFRELVESMRTQSRAPLLQISLSIPAGRSLQKDKADFVSSRELVALQGELLTADTFFGHAGRANQVEVISWNPSKRRYDFIVVENYGLGKGPKVVHPDRALCTTCHQNEGPILSRFPWRETAFQDKIRDKMRSEQLRAFEKRLRERWAEKGLSAIPLPADLMEGRGQFSIKSRITDKLDNFISTHRLEIFKAIFLKAWLNSPLKDIPIDLSEAKSMDDVLQAKTEAILNARREKKELPSNPDRVSNGFNLDTFGLAKELTQENLIDLNGNRIDNDFPEIRTDGSGFDRVVRLSNLRLQTMRACESICDSDDSKCKRSLLLLALLTEHPGLNESVRDSLNEDFRAIASSRWPKDGFAYPSSVLPDRDPLVSPEKGGVTTFISIKDKAAFLKSFEPRVDDDDIILDQDGNLRLDQDLKTSQFEHVKQFIETGASPIYLERNALQEATSFPGIRDSRVLGVQGIADPATPRPKVSGISLSDAATSLMDNSLLDCFGLARADVNELTLTSIDRIREVVMEDPRFDKILRPWPPNREQILGTFQEGLAASFARDDHAPVCHVDVPAPLETSEIVSLGRKIEEKLLTPPDRTKVVSLLNQYCAKCHGGNDPQASALPLNDVETMRAYKGEDGKRVVDLINSGKMPPKASNQPTQEERDLLLNILKGSQ